LKKYLNGATKDDVTEVPFVLDASVTLGWCFRDEPRKMIDIVTDRLEADDQAHVPLIWWFEIRHAALMGLRRQRVTAAHVLDFLTTVKGANIVVTPLPVASIVFDLAERHRLSFYDAAYLELAQRESIPLATLDQALARAATAEGVPLIGA